ncbi:MAG: SpoIIE family protein phosphatase [candidate division Zixibacteria bacterium]|nr:SpoIIE family protein phosphatase [candidate division Zixibacteria bacterium]
MFRHPIKEINAEFPAEEKYLEGIQRLVREACSAAGMKRKDVSAVLLAVEEGATNVIRHAYLYEKGALRLRITIYSRQMTFSIIDYGRSFRPEGRGKLDLDRLIESGRRGGLGFYMIQKIMDSVEYVSWSGQNELRMTRRLSRDDVDTTPPLFRRTLTLRVKFSFWTFLIVLLILVGAFYFVQRRTTEEIYRHLDGIVRALGETVAQQSALYIINHRSDVEFDELVVSYQRSNDFLQRVVLTDPSGTILAHSDDIRNIRKQYEVPVSVNPNEYGSPQRSVTGDQEVNFLALPITSGDQRLGTVYLTYSSAPVNERLRESRRTILYVTGVLLMVGVIGIYLLSNYFVRPIVNITRRVRRFSRGDFESELPLEGAAEFFEISSALNEMMTRLKHDRESLVERERMAKEIEVASQIQKTLLPRHLPELPGLEIDAFYRAASVIGGDLYDVFKISEDRCCFLVADVSGKGVPASLVMSMLRTVIKVYAEDAVSAKDVLVRVNDYLTENIPKGMFITVLLGIYDGRDHGLKLVSAGHNPLILFRGSTRHTSRFNPAGMPLGVPMSTESQFADAVEELQLQLEDGDAFIFYSDGITEAINREGQQYGVERLESFLHERWSSGSAPSISSLAGSLVEEIDSFSGYAQQRDDITFVLGRTRFSASNSEVETAIQTESIEQQTIDGGPQQQA